jgi:hypothetical protein
MTGLLPPHEEQQGQIARTTPVRFSLDTTFDIAEGDDSAPWRS